MPRKPARSSARPWMAIAGVVALVGLAFFARFYHPPAQVRANVTATEMTFVYRPIDPGPNPGPDVQLLAGAPLHELVVRSFDTLTANSGTLSVRGSSDEGWQPVPSSRTIVATKDSRTPAKAIFTNARIDGWSFKSAPRISLGFPRGEKMPRLQSTIEGGGIDLFFGAGDPIEFECQLCRIDGLGEEGAPRTREVRFAGLNQVPLKVSSSRTLVLDATTGPDGLGTQRFHFSQPRFCGGKGPESTVRGGTVEFPATGHVERLAGPVSGGRPASILRLSGDAVDPFSATALSIVSDQGVQALQLQFDGRAHTAELSDDCVTPGGKSVQPSYAAVLANNTLIATSYAALMLVFVWLGLYDKLKDLWARAQGKDSKK